MLADELHACIGGILGERDRFGETASYELDSELRSSRFSEQTKKADTKGQDYALHFNPEFVPTKCHAGARLSNHPWYRRVDPGAPSGRHH